MNAILPAGWFPLALFALFASLAQGQRIALTPAEPNLFPSGIDSNSPAWWRDGELYLITSAGTPLLSKGSSQFQWNNTETPNTELMDHKPFWIESVWHDNEGVLFGWYHHEPVGVCEFLTAPEIGAAYSRDGGASWRDLGIVLSAADPPDCDALNGYFAGGHGDFSVIADRAEHYLYFYFGNYGGDLASQGIAAARMPVGARWAPVGAVEKYHAGRWSEPGLGGRVTPVFPAGVAWQEWTADSFWGPAIHWNRYLGSYVMLMNRSCCEPGWPQEGIYATFNRDLARPQGWSRPERLTDSTDPDGSTMEPGWYPQVMGLGSGETDTLVGRKARLYMGGSSYWEVEFVRASGPQPRGERKPR